MRISIVLGTRPEIIKMSPIIRECERLGLDYQVVHTGQHYSHELDGVFFEELELPEPRYNLGVGSGGHGEQTGRIMIGLEPVLVKEKPDVVLVEGDTNSVLAGALTAAKLHIRVGHVEAGLRSYDRGMPEEINRVLTDHCSDLLFAPTGNSVRILRGEGVGEEKIHLTGNTVVDAVNRNLGLAERGPDVLSRYGLESGSYFVATIHRQENVDDPRRFSSILVGLDRVAERFGLPVVYPVHPRALKMMKEHGLKSNVWLIDAADYFTFLQLEKNARMIFTDSGGVQEEACILEVPCVTLRDNTERPETLEVGANVLAGTEPSEILNKAEAMFVAGRRWENPFGDGTAGVKIVEVLRKLLG